MVVFALLSGISIGMLSPFVKILFTPRPAVTAGGTPGAPVAGAPTLPGGGIPGLDAAGLAAAGIEAGASGAAPSESARVAGAPAKPRPFVALAERGNQAKQRLRTWFEHFFLIGDPIRSLTRICLALLVVFLLKNAVDYLQSVLTVW